MIRRNCFQQTAAVLRGRGKGGKCSYDNIDEICSDGLDDCLFVSCSFGGGKPAMMLEQYALEYPPPSLQDLNRIDEVIRVERFSLPRSSTMPRSSTGKNPTIMMTIPTIAGVPILGYGRRLPLERPETVRSF